MSAFLTQKSYRLFGVVSVVPTVFIIHCAKPTIQIEQAANAYITRASAHSSCSSPTHPSTHPALPCPALPPHPLTFATARPPPARPIRQHGISPLRHPIALLIAMPVLRRLQRRSLCNVHQDLPRRSLQLFRIDLARENAVDLSCCHREFKFALESPRPGVTVWQSYARLHSSSFSLP